MRCSQVLESCLLPERPGFSEGNEVSPKASARETQEWERRHYYSFQRLWQMDFRLLEEMPLSPRPLNISRQVVLGPDYYSEGRLRAQDDHCYFCYTLSGEGTFWDAQGVYPVPPGQGFLIEIDDMRTGYRAEMEAEEPWQFLAFTFTGLSAHAMTRDLTARYGSIFALTPQSLILQRLLSYATKSYGVSHPHALDGAEIVIELLLALAASARAKEEPDAAQSLVRRALLLIEEHSEAPLSVQELARQLGISRERLSRVFRLQLNLSPHQLILEQKMRRACFLLKDTDLPIKQIAAQLGYTDYTNFTRAFRQVMQMTPHQFHLRGSIPFLPRLSPR